MKISNYQQLLECYVRCEDLFEEDSDSGLAIHYYLYAEGDILTTHFVGDHTKHLGGILTDFKTKEQYVIVD